MHALLTKPSIEDMLPYLVSGGKTTRRERAKRVQLSELEEIALLSQKNLVREKGKNTNISKKALEKENSKAKIKDAELRAKASYEFFMPAKQSRYSSIEINYSVSESIRVLELKLEEGKDSFQLRIDKPSAEQQYSALFLYDKERQGYHVRYEADYVGRLEEARQDFTKRIDKALDLLPKSLMGGILGFTYLGSGKMTRRDDLFGERALMVDVHESIHTPDEYETRVLTDWILTRDRQKYKR